MIRTDIKQFAGYIQRAVQIREASWNGHEYDKTIRDAVDKVTPPEWSEIVYLLLMCAWNDAQDWATEAMKHP